MVPNKNPTIPQFTHSANWFPALTLILLFLATVTAYAPSLKGRYLWDDSSITDNPAVQDRAGIVDIWFHPSKLTESESHYWPVTYSSFWIEYRIWGANPLCSRLVNIALHVLNASLLFVLLLRIRQSRFVAALAAFLFALHPVHAESVAWIIERKDVLSGLFYLLSFLTFIEYRIQNRRAFYWFSLLLFTLAMWGKSIAVTLPAGLVIWLWWQGRPIRRADILDLAVFGLLALGLSILDMSIYKWAVSTVERPLPFQVSFLQRTLVATRSLWFYITKLVWPTELMSVYPRWSIFDRSLPALIPSACTIVFALAIALTRKRIGNGPAACMLFFAITLAPVLGFIDFSYLWTYSFVADRFQYLASIGPLILIAAGFYVLHTWLLPKARWLIPCIAALVLVLLWARTFQTSAYYRSNADLFLHNIEANPNHYVPYLNAGSAYLSAGKIDEAEEMFLRTLILNPASDLAVNDLGAVMERRGNYEAALTYFNKAIELNPDNAKYLMNKARILTELDRNEEASELLKRAASNNPGIIEAQMNTVEILMTQHKYAEAKTALAKLKQRYPENAAIRMNSGNIAFHEHRFKDAIDEYSYAVRLDPSLAEAHYQLGVILPAFHRESEAVDHLRQSLTMKPEWPDAQNNLAWLLCTQPKQSFYSPKEALQLAEVACQKTHYAKSNFCDTLAVAYAANTQFSNAIRMETTARDIATSQTDVSFARVAEKKIQLFRSQHQYSE